MPTKIRVRRERAKKRVKRIRKVRQMWEDLMSQLLVDIIKPLYGQELYDRTMSLEDALHDYFNTDYREVYFIRFEQDLKIHGEHWLSMSTRSKNTGPRDIKAGATGLLRIDTRDEGKVDIQVKLAGETDQLFSLTVGQWRAIKKKITVVYKSPLTGKDQTRARHLKQYHAAFVRKHLGCGFEYRTASGLVRPNFKETKV